ncbi:hypothetical protein Tco_1255096 [Tanacetum coccineum]
MSGTQDENPPPPPPPSTQQTPTQQTPHTVSTIKLPILKKGEYDIWAMKMEHYLAHIDYPIWEVIQNGNGPVSVITDTSGQIKILPPKTGEEIVARERERKARTTLLMAIPKDHLAKFHKMTDANAKAQIGSWLVQDQTVLGKDYSNLLIADSLLKTIWFINAPCYDNEALASPNTNDEELSIPEQTATGKGTSNPLMAGSLPKTTKPT